MAAEAAVQNPVQGEGGQLRLYEALHEKPVSRRRVLLVPHAVAKLCAGCRGKEARYGFREHDGADRPRTLCFECFRMELDFRQRVAAQLSRGWNAEQARLPLAETLKELTTRRRRAQIAARHAIGA